MKKFITKISKKELIFFSFMLLSIVPLFFFKYYVSLDGPQHLYNANVLTEIIKGNTNLSDYFKINPVIVGYWAGHFFLGFFKFFFPSWLAEKLFIISYIIGTVYAFRYLVRSVNREHDYMTILIFPLAYSMYFMMGYYSFSIAFTPMFLIFGYLIRHPKLNFKNMLILSILFLALFLSHAFVFAMTGLAIGIYLFTEFIFSKFKGEKIDFKSFLLKAGKIFLSGIPAIVLWLIYIRYVMTLNSMVIPESYNFKELLNYILRMRQLVEFHHENEAVGTMLIFNVLMILFADYLTVLSNLKGKKRKEELFSQKNIWFVLAVGFFILYLFMPNRISAGSLTNRVGLLFFYFLITALAMRKSSKTVVYFSAILLFVSFLYLQIYRTQEQIKLNRLVNDIHTVEDHIEKNSTLYSIRCSDNWFDLHFGCYAGVDKPLVNLNSPQNRGQFPIVWNYKHLPVLKMGNKSIKIAKPECAPKSVNNQLKEVDYVLIYHKHKDYKLSEEDVENLKRFYILIYLSPGGYADLYKLRK